MRVFILRVFIMRVFIVLLSLEGTFSDFSVPTQRLLAATPIKKFIQTLYVYKLIIDIGIGYIRSFRWKLRLSNPLTMLIMILIRN